MSLSARAANLSSPISVPVITILNPRVAAASTIPAPPSSGPQTARTDLGKVFKKSSNASTSSPTPFDSLILPTKRTTSSSCPIPYVERKLLLRLATGLLGRATPFGITSTLDAGTPRPRHDSAS